MSELVSDSDEWGVINIELRNQTIDSYYERIKDIKPLLRAATFTEAVTGYYLNIKTVKLRNWLRLSIFSENASQAISQISKYLQGIEIGIHPTKTDMRDTISLATRYGVPELEFRFRRYLTDYTQIGLELINCDLAYARRLMLWLRYRVIAGSLDVKEQIEPSLLKMSAYYRSMSREKREGFLEDLERKPKPEETDWAHFMYNFVSGLPDPRGVRGRYGGIAWSIDAINDCVKKLGNTSLHLPINWKPFGL